MRVFDNNTVSVVGKTCSDLEFSHEVFGEGFYTVRFEVPRLSNYNDVLPITISERLLVDYELKEDKLIRVEGQLRSYNKIINENNKLILTIFARDLQEVDESAINNPNQIFLDGFVCKKPVYRTTPFGREITDMLVAVNRPYRKSDYIPCIAWGRNARFSEKLRVGDKIKLWGRMQSREYQKKIDEEEVIRKIAYEVSISKMESFPDENNRMDE